MTSTISLSAIRNIIETNSPVELLQIIEAGFVLYATGKVQVPPVGHLAFVRPPADVHIKYGYIEDDDFYVIKIASGFYENPSHGLPPGNGMMIIFSQKTGEVLSILLDEGFLTDIRTAIAGAVASKYLAPSTVKCIGVVGTGVQARLQLKYLQMVTDCREAMVWGRTQDKVDLFKNDPYLKDFSIQGTTAISQLTKRCNLIVTCTASRAPVLMSDDILQGTHITAMGADASGKQEIDARLIARADIVVADSIEQCIDHGDIGYAVRDGQLSTNRIASLGDMIRGKANRRANDREISIADLTGVAIQDIQIAKYVYLKYRSQQQTGA